jgi:hypothetical protein
MAVDKKDTLILVQKSTHEMIKEIAEQEQRSIKVMVDIMVKFWLEKHR